MVLTWLLSGCVPYTAWLQLRNTTTTGHVQHCSYEQVRGSAASQAGSQPEPANSQQPSSNRRGRRPSWLGRGGYYTPCTATVCWVAGWMLHGCRYYNHAVQSCTKVHFGHHIRSGGGECLGGRPGRAGWLVQWCKCSRAKQQPVRASGRRARAANQRGSLFQCSQRAARRTTAYQIRVSQMQSSRPHPSSLRRLNNDEARAFLETRDYNQKRCRRPITTNVATARTAAHPG